jgi:hypothetical protein
MVEKELLLTVENHFLLEGRGLTVIPDIDLPGDDRRFIQFSDKVAIRRPDGTEDRLSVDFFLTHFSLVGGGCKWRITPILPEGTKETVPVGSQLFVSAETMRKLNGIIPNKPDAADK